MIQQFKYKKHGANVKVIYGTDSYGKRVTVDEGAEIKSLVEKHNDAVDRNLSDKYIKQIYNKVIKLVTKNTERVKQQKNKKAIAAKSIKKRINKTAKKSINKKESVLLKTLTTSSKSDFSKEVLDAMEKLLNEGRAITQGKAALTSKKRRSGEF